MDFFKDSSTLLPLYENRASDRNLGLFYKMTKENGNV